MKRILEPELMLDAAQALAYARADFEDAHGRIVAGFVEAFPDRPASARLVDLGCGPGDITLRLGRANPEWEIVGVDASDAMLEIARDALRAEPPLAARIRFVKAYLPDFAPNGPRFDALFSNSLLHHLPDPAALWSTVRQVAAPGALVYVADLFRPPSPTAAAAMVDRYSANEPEVLRRDFYNSLLAAFTVEEVRAQLDLAGLTGLSVRAISDRHLVVAGHLPAGR